MPILPAYAAILLSASDWPWPEYEGLMELLQTKFVPIRKHCAKLITSNQRWSNSIGQLNFLSFALRYKSNQVGCGTPKLYANLREWVFNQILSKLDGELEMLFYSNHKQVSPQLKDLGCVWFPENKYFSEMLFFGKENVFKYLVALWKLL